MTLLALISAGWPLLADGQPEAPSSWTLREVPLGPAGTILDVARDRSRVARLVKGNGVTRVLVDSNEVPAEDGVLFATFSRDGRRFAFVRKREGKLQLVVDGIPQWDWKGAGFASNMRAGFWFNPTGARWFLLVGHTGFTMLTLKRPDNFLLVVDGKPVADDTIGTFITSEAGSRFGYLARRPDRSGNETVALVLHGSEGEESHHLGVSTSCLCDFSPDGKRVTYSTRRHGTKEVLVVVNEPESAEYEELKWPVFSADSSRLALPAKRSGRWIVILDGQEGAAYEEIGEGLDFLGRKRSVTFSPDGRRHVYMAKRRGAWVPVIDGAEGEEYEELGQPTFSADSKHVAYPAKRSGRWFVVVDGKAGRPYQRVDHVAFSPAGNRLVYTGQAAGKWIVAFDGGESAPYDEVAKPALSPGGEHLAYAAKRAGRWFLVVDGTQGKEYEFLTDRTLVFDSERRFHTLIQRGKEYLRLEAEIEP